MADVGIASDAAAAIVVVVVVVGDALAVLPTTKTTQNYCIVVAVAFILPSRFQLHKYAFYICDLCAIIKLKDSVGIYRNDAQLCLKYEM